MLSDLLNSLGFAVKSNMLGADLGATGQQKGTRVVDVTVSISELRNPANPEPILA